MGFGSDFNPFSSGGKSFHRDLEKIREPLLEAQKKASAAGVDVDTTRPARADDSARALIARLIEFETPLAPHFEAAARLLGPASPIVLRVDDVFAEKGDLLVLTGWLADGQRVELAQHYSLVSLLIVIEPRLPDAPPRDQRGIYRRRRQWLDEAAKLDEALAKTEAPAPPAADQGPPPSA